MKNIAILTPSYRPDFHRLVQLHQSVLEFTDEFVVHHVIVPQRDLQLFRQLESSRLRIYSEAEFMPDGFVATDGLAAIVQKSRVLPPMLRFSAVNLRHPWPPVRGWMLQQILKLSAAPRLGVDGVIIIDSDVVLVRQMKPQLFFQGDAVRLYEKPAAITSAMHRHVMWTRAAHKLLGLPEPKVVSLPDYVAGIISWDPSLVASCLQRIQEVTGVPWASAIAVQMHFSEFILYGTYVRNFGGIDAHIYAGTSTYCHSYWRPEPMTGTQIEGFTSSFGSSDIAVHIQSNSSTPDTVRSRILENLRNVHSH